MTNKNYFNHLCDTKLYLGDFFLTFSPIVSNYVQISEPRFSFDVYSISGFKLPLTGSVVLTSRFIHTELHYIDFTLSKFSSYELREWFPVIFQPCSNYLHWRKFMKVALEIYVESNPKLLLSDNGYL